jgi:hypothetical protein
MVSFLDAEIGRMEAFLEAEGYNENLLTLFVSDHGSAVGDNGLQVKGPHDTNDISHVPMIFRWPGEIRPGCSDRLVQTIDVGPTILDLLGLPCPPVSGSSLAESLRGVESADSDYLFSEGSFPLVHPGIRESVRTGDHLYTRYPDLGQEELFALRLEPAEPGLSINIADSRRDICARLGQVLDEWRAVHPLHPDLFDYVSGGIDYEEKMGWDPTAGRQ